MVKRFFALGLFGLFLFSLGVYAGGYERGEGPFPSRFTNTTNRQGEVDFDLFWKVYDLLGEKYVDQPLDHEALLYGAIEGLVGATGDPYTLFLDPEQTQAFQEDINGASFEGVGIEIGLRDEILTIVAPIDGTPAAQAGLRPGDQIIRIDGEITTDLSLDEAVNRIRGERGTEVVLSIAREGRDDVFDVSITRGTIEVKSVRTEQRDNVFVISLTQFGADTSSDFSNAVDEFLASDADRVVLDLRGNPGGLLQSSVEIASEFIEDGTIVIEEFTAGDEEVYEAEGRARLADTPVVVLVNEGSASASEILAGALRDRRGVQLVGQQSFGKGSVQEYELLRDGSSIRITVAKWLTPDRTEIHEVGLAPDIAVEFTEEDFDAGRDPQLDRAVEEVKAL